MTGEQVSQVEEVKHDGQHMNRSKLKETDVNLISWQQKHQDAPRAQHPKDDSAGNSRGGTDWSHVEDLGGE